MVALDCACAARAAFDYVRVDRSLQQEFRSAEFLGFFLKHANKLFTDDLTLSFRLRHTR
ncbi:hypothetical protein SDC9_157402 [bioreactor metagenome]|uniref:Uncharacterized protein n=1 Tax=bioreactor metagenome TaxID=1076179 RepID=A0A645F9W8_9ZZZZ